MIKAKEIFWSQHRNEQKNVTYNKLEYAINNGLLGVKATELLSTMNIDLLKNDNLTYSNEYLCDLIIDKVYKFTDNANLKKLIENTYLGFIQSESEIASAYEKFDDNSYLITIGDDIVSHLYYICDFLGAYYLNKYNYFSKYPKLYDEIVYCCVKKDKNNIFYEYANYEIETLFSGLENGENLLYSFCKITEEALEIAFAFIIGHEYGHHFLNHTERNELVKEFSSIENSGLFDNLADNHFEEFNADKFALYFIIEFLKFYGHDKLKRWQYYGIACSIIVLSVLDNNLLKHSDSHPSVKSRYCNILLGINKYYGNDVVKEIYDVVKWFYYNSNYHNWNGEWWDLDELDIF